MLQTMQWTGSALRLLDQTKLPTKIEYIDITDEKQMWDAIKRLVVRGAPAIGVAAAFGTYLGVRDTPELTELTPRLDEVCAYLKTSRPTAVNLAWAVDRIHHHATLHPKHYATPDRLLDIIKKRIFDECLAMLDEDKRSNRAIGEHGVELLKSVRANSPINILTHCNAGALAATAYGMSLAPIYVGMEQGMRFHVWADETRPLLQGSRLTALELHENNVPVTVLCDNMAASVMSARKVDAVIVGADRIAANGDVANKIGTLGVAILARHFKVPFFVAAPTSTIDLATKSGNDIPIEFRDGREISHGYGGAQTAPDGVETFNPAFDVTPAELVDAIITNKGVIRAPYDANLKKVLT